MDVFPASRLELGALDRRKTALFICDIQERYREVLNRFSEVVDNTKKVITGCKHLMIPMIVTEQFPGGLGHTVKEIETHEAVMIASKEQFSMMVPDIEAILPTVCQGSLASVILCGMETHVALEQTAIELLARGLHVHVVADCTTSRCVDDRNIALQRLMQIGCFVSTLETVLFKLLGSKNHPKFKIVAQLAKKPSKSIGLALVL